VSVCAGLRSPRYRKPPTTAGREIQCVRKHHPPAGCPRRKASPASPSALKGTFLPCWARKVPFRTRREHIDVSKGVVSGKRRSNDRYHSRDPTTCNRRKSPARAKSSAAQRHPEIVGPRCHDACMDLNTGVNRPRTQRKRPVRTARPARPGRPPIWRCRARRKTKARRRNCRASGCPARR